MLHCLVSPYCMWDSLWLRIQTLFSNPNTTPSYRGLSDVIWYAWGVRSLGEYGFKAFEEFHFPPNIHPVAFAQMCSFYHQGKLSESPQTQAASQITSGSININTSKINAEVKETNPGQESVLGQVWVDNTCQAICILANSVKVMQGRTNKITQQLSCMVEARACNNLPRGIVVNRTMITPHKISESPLP